MRKDKIVILLVSLIICCGLIAPIQAQEYNNAFSIKAGLSIPVLDFASVNLDEGSFALPGFTAGLEFGRTLYRGFGIQVSAGVSLFPIDVDWLAYQKVQDDPFLQDLSIRSEAFRTLEFSTGVYYPFKLWNKFQVVPSLLIGMLYAKTPYQLNKPEYFMTGPPFYEITSSRDHKLFVGPAFRVNYNLRPETSLGITAEYIFRNMAFGFYNWEGLYYTYRKVSYFNVSLSLINHF